QDIGVAGLGVAPAAEDLAPQLGEPGQQVGPAREVLVFVPGDDLLTGAVPPLAVGVAPRRSRPAPGAPAHIDEIRIGQQHGAIAAPDVDDAGRHGVPPAGSALAPFGVAATPAASRMNGPAGAVGGLRLPWSTTLTFSGPCSAITLSARRTDLPLRLARTTNGLPSSARLIVGVPAGWGSGGTRSAGSKAGFKSVLIF